jgi:L-cysteine desulfidase
VYIQIRCIFAFLKKGSIFDKILLMNQSVLEILRRQVVPALGCTEPVAVGVATARAKELLGTVPDKVHVLVSGNIYKNGMGVGIPATKSTGLPMAVALSALYCKSSNGLEIFEDIGSHEESGAKLFLQEKTVNIEVKNGTDKLYVETSVFKGAEYAKVLICQHHDNIVLEEKNHKILLDIRRNDKNDGCTDDEWTNNVKLKDVYQFTRNVLYEDIAFLQLAIDMNCAIAAEGLTKHYGLHTGRIIERYIEKGILKDDLASYAVKLTSAAADARMAGSTLPVMTNSGSGNQGLSVSLPVIAAAQKLSSDAESTIRAMALAQLTAIYMKQFLGKLSGFCGVTIASAGASAGIVDLLGGNYNHVTKAISNMAGTISGMLCDGAKPGCALKMSSGAYAAVLAALIAMENMSVSDPDGFVTPDIEDTMRTIGNIGNKGMQVADDMILEKMQKREPR